MSAIGLIDSDPACDVDVISSVYETRPFGIEDQADFLNAVVRIYSAYSPDDLFIFMKSIEQKLGREKTIKWGPREIDLDILLYNDLIYENEILTIPHIGITERNFVLLPLAEINSDLVHPVTGKKIIDYLAEDASEDIINKFTLTLQMK